MGAASEVTMDAQEVLVALSGPSDIYQRDAVQAAMDRPDEVVPLLLEHLEEVVQEPERFKAADYESQLPAYAVVLLSHHRVAEAHRLFIDLLSLPGETPFDLFGDMVTETFRAAMWKTCGGDVTSIKRLIENAKANEYCRATAMRSLTFGVVDGGLVREEVVEYLQSLFSLPEASQGGGLVFDAAAAALCDLWPGESMEIITKGFKDEVIWPGYIGPESFEEALQEDKEAWLGRLRRWVPKELAKSPHEAMAWWACFRLGHSRRNAQRTRPKKNAAKRKRKQAKAARKKGRRKKR